MKLSHTTRRLVNDALVEDLGPGDITTQVIGARRKPGRAALLAKAEGILFGSLVFEEVFRRLDQRMRVRWTVRDGQAFKAGTILARLDGDQTALLTGERTALNFLAHLSGVATLTRKFVKAVSGTGTCILDTRKTTPGWRELEKQAVRAGRGVNHRMGLYDAVMIKNNHITACGGIETALKRVQAAQQRKKQRIPVICEVRTLAELRKAVEYGITWILLDHFGPARLRMAVSEIRRSERKTRRHIVLECSGGVTLRNVHARATTGVDFISVGALTQSAPAVDVSLRML